MENAVVPFQEVEKMAVAVAKSGLFGCKTPEQAVTLMLIAQAEGIPVMQAVLDYNIIDNKPALKADAMLRRFQKAGGVVKWVERTDKKVSAYFSHPSCPDPILIDWDFERAAKAELSTRQYKSGGTNMWNKYPRQMLTARVISEGVRATYPGAYSGVYTPEEVVDFAEPVKPSVVQPSPSARQAQDAEVVHPAEPIQPEIKPLSDKTLSKFRMAKQLLNGEYEEILKRNGFNTAEEIKDEEHAKSILREMRVAVESKPKQPAEVAK